MLIRITTDRGGGVTHRRGYAAASTYFPCHCAITAVVAQEQWNFFLITTTVVLLCARLTTRLTTLRSRDIAAAAANKLEKDPHLSLCPPELVITHWWAHLHPKSTLIHFAKSSGVSRFACWWTVDGGFSLQSSVCILKTTLVWGILHHHEDTLLVVMCEIK